MHLHLAGCIALLAVALPFHVEAPGLCGRGCCHQSQPGLCVCVHLRAAANNSSRAARTHTHTRTHRALLLTSTWASLPSQFQVALTAVKDAMGSVSYVEFVLHPAPIFEAFVSVADNVLEAIQPAGGTQPSEPRQQVSQGTREAEQEEQD